MSSLTLARWWRFLPADEWRSLRLAVFLLGSALLVLAASGVLDTALFAQQSNTKYLVCVMGAATVTLLVTIRAPMRFLLFIAILVAPFDFVFTFQGLQPTPLLAVDVVALCVALPRRPRSTASLAPAAAALPLLLLPAIIGSTDPGYWFVWLGVTLASGYLAFLVAREDGGPTLIAIALTVAAFVQGALAVWEFKTGHQLNLYQASASTATSDEYFFTYGSVFRPSGATPDPIGLGQVLALCIPMTVALSASLRRRIWALAAVAMAGVAALGLALSLSRMSLVGGWVGLVVTLALLPKRVRIRTILFVAAATALVVLMAFGIAPQALSKRISSIFDPTAAHVSTSSGDILRLHIWAAALRTIEANPLTGVGFGHLTQWLPKYGVAVNSASEAHDVYLQLFAEGGVLGIVAILVMVYSYVRDLWRSFGPHRIWVAGAAGALVAQLLAWSTDFQIKYVQISAPVAVVFGLVAALVDRPADAPAERLL